MKLEEIAALAGVSRTTASYVINGKAEHYRISLATREKVLAVVAEHNYQPDSRASALRSGQTRTLGFILPDLENSSYARLAKLLEQGARLQGYQLLIVCSEDDPETERKLAQLLLARHVDALLVASCLPPDDRWYYQRQQEGATIIGVDRILDPNHFITVGSENYIASKALTLSLLRDNLHQIALITARPELTISQERRKGFLAALEGVTLEIDECAGNQFSRSEGYRLLQQLHQKRGALPEALVTTSYSLLEGVLDYLLELGIDMQQITMATFGDDRLLDFLPCGINSLPQHHEAIAKQVLTLAFAAINGDYRVGFYPIERNLHQRAHTNG